MLNNIDPHGILIIRQGGFYYNVSGNDALILNKYLGYKLYGIKEYKTGFPVKGEKTVLKKIDTLGMDYDLLDQNGSIVKSMRFENNRYEIIDAEYPRAGIKSDLEEPKKLIKDRRKSLKESLAYYIDVLQGLSEGLDILTGELVEGLDEELKLALFEMSVYFDQKLKKQEKLEENYPNHGKKWTDEEEQRIIQDYNQGKSLRELSLLYKRGTGAIRSHLIKLGVEL